MIKIFNQLKLIKFCASHSRARTFFKKNNADSIVCVIYWHVVIVHEWQNLLRSCQSFSHEHTSSSTSQVTWENGVLVLWRTCKARLWGQGQLNWSSLVLLNTANLFFHCFSSGLLACQNYCNCSCFPTSVSKTEVQVVDGE